MNERTPSNSCLNLGFVKLLTPVCVFQSSWRNKMKNLTLKLILVGLLLAGSAGVSLAIDPDGGNTVSGTVYESISDTPDAGNFDLTGGNLF